MEAYLSGCEKSLMYFLANLVRIRRGFRNCGSSSRHGETKRFCRSKSGRFHDGDHRFLNHDSIRRFTAMKSDTPVGTCIRLMEIQHLDAQ